MKCYDCIAPNVNVTVVEDGHRPRLGRDLIPQPRLSLTQSKQTLKIDH